MVYAENSRRCSKEGKPSLLASIQKGPVRQAARQRKPGGTVLVLFCRETRQIDADQGRGVGAVPEGP